MEGFIAHGTTHNGEVLHQVLTMQRSNMRHWECNPSAHAAGLGLCLSQKVGTLENSPLKAWNQPGDFCNPGPNA